VANIKAADFMILDSPEEEGWRGLLEITEVDKRDEYLREGLLICPNPQLVNFDSFLQD
jgi:hypothetical protein